MYEFIIGYDKHTKINFCIALGVLFPFERPDSCALNSMDHMGRLCTLCKRSQLWLHTC